MQTNCDRVFVLSIEESMAGSFAEVMSYDCMCEIYSVAAIPERFLQK